MRTAESITPQHPDKLCDRISDAILDECLRQDPDSRVAVETMGGHGIVTVTGEVTTNAFFDARKIVERIAPGNGVQINIVKQSPEIANGVDTGGAGDQGIMNGYACRETQDLIPLEHFLARDLCQFIWDATIVDGHQDGKTQITVNEDNEITAIVASFCKIKKEVLLKLIKAWMNNPIPARYMGSTTVHANPAGDWNIGGFEADTGLTGRKLAVDNYGTRTPIGGGAFSGKDASKVDRSAAYKARQMAVRILQREEKAQEVFVQLAYAIGIAAPVMATATVKDGYGHVKTLDLVKDGIAEATELTPAGIIETLGLKDPQFERTAEWGHFGRNFTWDDHEK